LVMEARELDSLDEAEQGKRLSKLVCLARCSQEDKARLIQKLQEAGEVVAATGDGQAETFSRRPNVAISLGMTGTELAKQ